MHLVVEDAAGRLRQPQAVAGVAGRRQRDVALAGGDVAVDARASSAVVAGEAAAGEHDAAPRA